MGVRSMGLVTRDNSAFFAVFLISQLSKFSVRKFLAQTATRKMFQTCCFGLRSSLGESPAIAQLGFQACCVGLGSFVGRKSSNRPTSKVSTIHVAPAGRQLVWRVKIPQKETHSTQSEGKMRPHIESKPSLTTSDQFKHQGTTSHIALFDGNQEASQQALLAIINKYWRLLIIMTAPWSVPIAFA